jgi:hypothetical protein
VLRQYATAPSAAPPLYGRRSADPPPRSTGTSLKGPTSKVSIPVLHGSQCAASVISNPDTGKANAVGPPTALSPNWGGRDAPSTASEQQKTGS